MNHLAVLTVKNVLMMMVTLNHKNNNLLLCHTFVVRGSQS